jgi:hypothetical protein
MGHNLPNKDLTLKTLQEVAEKGTLLFLHRYSIALNHEMDRGH